MFTNSDPFKPSLQAARAWLTAIGRHMACGDRQTAYEALSAVLQVLRKRLPPESVLGLAAHLPLVIRGLFLEGWQPQEGSIGGAGPHAFIDAVADRLPTAAPISAIAAVEAVLAVLAEKLDQREVTMVLDGIPAALKGSSSAQSQMSPALRREGSWRQDLWI